MLTSYNARARIDREYAVYYSGPISHGLQLRRAEGRGWLYLMKARAAFSAAAASVPEPCAIFLWTLVHVRTSAVGASRCTDGRANTKKALSTRHFSCSAKGDARPTGIYCRTAPVRSNLVAWNEL